MKYTWKIKLMAWMLSLAVLCSLFGTSMETYAEEGEVVNEEDESGLDVDASQAVPMEPLVDVEKENNEQQIEQLQEVQEVLNRASVTGEEEEPEEEPEDLGKGYVTTHKALYQVIPSSEDKQAPKCEEIRYYHFQSKDYDMYARVFVYEDKDPSIDLNLAVEFMTEDELKELFTDEEWQQLQEDNKIATGEVTILQIGGGNITEKYPAGVVLAYWNNEKWGIYDPETTYTKICFSDNTDKIYDDDANVMLPYSKSMSGNQVVLTIKDDAIDETSYYANYTSDYNTIVQKVLDIARDKATEARPYVIVMPSGTYVAKNPLHIYSNTTLDARNQVTVKATSSNRRLLESGISDYTKDKVTGAQIWPSENYAGYDYFKNITILGGTWDGWGREDHAEKSKHHAMMVYAHVTNLVYDGVVMQNSYNCHMLEVAAIDGMTVKNCTFQDDMITDQGSNSYEALQIDMTHDRTDNFPHYYVQDDLATINCEVVNCTFKNLRRGMGNHHVVLDSNFDNIKVHDNQFINIEDKAIMAFHWTNSSIENNVMDQVSCGVKMKAVQSKLYKPNSDPYVNGAPVPYELKCNNVIANNTITLLNPNKTDGQNTPYGLYIGGVENYGTSTTTTAPNGKYYLKKITVKNNVITGRAIAGIYLDLAKNCTISDNVVDFTNAKAGTSIIGNGISLGREVFSTSITSNTIKNLPTSGNGIQVAAGVKDTTIDKNKLSNIGKNGIYIAENSTVKKINSNEMTNVVGNAIQLQDNCVSTDIASNVINGIGNHGIVLYNGNKCTNIKDNKMTNVGCNGIQTKGATVTNIKSNTISKAKNNGISLIASSSSQTKVTEVSSNVISDSGKYGMNITGSSISKLKNNCIQRAKSYGIYIASGAKVSKIENNTLTACKSDNKIYINGSKSKPTAAIVYKKTQYTLSKGDQMKVCPEYKSNYGAVTYSSSNKKVATVNKTSGVVKGKKTGTVTITAKQNGVKTTTKIKVVKAPSKVSVAEKAITLKKGKTYKLSPMVNSGRTCHLYTYKSSKKKVATVSSSGKIKAKKKGTTYVTIKTYNGKKVKVKVKVK